MRQLIVHSGIEEFKDPDKLEKLLRQAIKRGWENNPAEYNKLLNALPHAIKQYIDCSDHGLAHSQYVFERCKELLRLCPNVASINRHRPLSIDKKLQALRLAALLHDFPRYLGYKTPEHEKIAAKLLANLKCRQLNYTDNQCLNIAVEAAYHHDWLCEAIDGPMPDSFSKQPLAEIFRLADKTSLLPAEEITRYMECSNRHKLRFFDPDLPDDIRFNMKNNHDQRDAFTHFLVLFSIKPSDFLYAETSEAYRDWANGKCEAIARIFTLANNRRFDESTKQHMMRILENYLDKIEDSQHLDSFRRIHG